MPPKSLGVSTYSSKTSPGRAEFWAQSSSVVQEKRDLWDAMQQQGIEGLFQPVTDIIEAFLGGNGEGIVRRGDGGSGV